MKARTNISDLGLLRPWVSSRRRLVISTVVLSTIAIVFGFLSARYILEISTSVVFNLFLITLNMMVVLVAAFLQAVLIGEFAFPGPWREQVILGDTQEHRISVKNHGAEFTIVFVLAVVANVGAIEIGSGGFFDRYHNEAFFEVRLRSSDPFERFAAFEDLRDPMNYALWTRESIQDLILQHLMDPDDRTSAAAVWLAGHIKLEAARPALHEVATKGAEASRREAFYALGKLGTHDESRALLEEIAQLDDPARIDALKGLALMSSPLSFDLGLKLVRHDDQQTRIHALWLIRNLRDSTARDVIRARLNADVDELEMCALLDALKLVATSDDITWARLAFNNTPKDKACPPQIWEERDEKQHYITYSDSLRVKYLKIVANTDARSHVDWFKRLVNDSNEEVHVREVANEVMKRM